VQTHQVDREAAESDGLLGLPRCGIKDAEALRANMDDARFSRSPLRALMVLMSCPGNGTDRSVSDVAKHSETPFAAYTARTANGTLARLGCWAEPDSPQPGVTASPPKQHMGQTAGPSTMASRSRASDRRSSLRSAIWWSYGVFVRLLGSTRTLDSHACRLRAKLARDGDSFVVNVWGVGYRLVDGPVGER
jgi:Transcriptional regulatory protein, C terminal